MTRGRTTRPNGRSKRAVVVCGPTASGKSSFVDLLDERPVIMVDSLQVYREIPEITNQRSESERRHRDVRLCGFLPVTEGWSVGEHSTAVEQEVRGLSESEGFLLEAGTGMYLNALLLDIDLYPKVSEETRKRAERTENQEIQEIQNANPRREARLRELEISGVETGGSIWEGPLRYDALIAYLRPERETLDKSIETRSREISSSGLGEAELLRDLMRDGQELSPSVRDSIGVRELLEVVSGELELEEASRRIASRTRRLARRQIRWFDKLVTKLEARVPIYTIEDPAHASSRPEMLSHLSRHLHGLHGR